MTTTRLSDSARKVVDDVLTVALTKELWSSGFDKVLPMTMRNFDISAALPMMFYLFRFGERRGTGKFTKVFGDEDAPTFRERRKAATIDKVAHDLSDSGSFEGFGGVAQKAILGDLLLCFCLENTDKSLGRTQQVQRVLPAHYMASWVDLPESAHHLGDFPTMLVALMADQSGKFVERNSIGHRTRYAVSTDFSENALLNAFGAGMEIKSGLGAIDSRTGDLYDETVSVSVDQLLMIRLAQRLAEAPQRTPGKGSKIPNQRPIAHEASRKFAEDMRNFIYRYSGIPRHSLVSQLESCLAIGMTSITTSSIQIVCDWAETGKISKPNEQQPTPLFVDCSSGSNRHLRLLSEQNMDDVLRRSENYSKAIVAMKLMDHYVRHNSGLQEKHKDIMDQNDSTEWLNFLGDVLHRRIPESDLILGMIDMQTNQLSEKLTEKFGEDYEPSIILKNLRGNDNPALRLAEGLTAMKHPGATHGLVVKLLDSGLMSDRPNGLSKKRSVARRVGPGSNVKRRLVRSIVFTDWLLDYLVHLHLSVNGGPDRHLSLQDFLVELRNRHGLFIDQAPAGMDISNELLQLNRSWLERRLRDQGLLIGVNDAESMKQIRSRFPNDEE